MRVESIGMRDELSVLLHGQDGVAEEFNRGANRGAGGAGKTDVGKRRGEQRRLYGYGRTVAQRG